MSQRTCPERASSSGSAHIYRERQEPRQNFRHSRSQGHRRTNILSMHSSLRRPLSRRHTISNPQSELLELSESGASQPSYTHQDQFINGRPTASLNGQHPGVARAFSRSSSRFAQYEAVSTPNIAYIERTSSMRSQDTGRGTQVPDRIWEGEAIHGGLPSAPGSLRLEDNDNMRATSSHSTQTPSSFIERRLTYGPANHLESLDLAELEELDERGVVTQFSPISTSTESNYDAEQSIAQVLANASKQDVRFEAEHAWNDRSMEPDVPPRRRPISYAGSRHRMSGSRSLATRSTVGGMVDRGDAHSLQGEDQDHKQTVEEGDYFGDSIEGEEHLTPPIPPRSPHRSRSSTPEISIASTMQLFAANPDPQSGSATEDDLPIRPLPIGISQRYPSHRSSRLIQPVSTSYPSPLRQGSINRQATGTSGMTKEGRTHDLQASETRPSRLNRFFTCMPLRYNRDRQTEAEENQGDEFFATNVFHNTAFSHWALHLIQGFIWLPLTIYFFLRVSKLQNAVAFECYELKAQLLHLGENMTLPLFNSTAMNETFANSATFPTKISLATLSDPNSERTNASSIPIPEEYHSKLKSHCILQPVNRAVVLASSFVDLFIMTIVACGLAHGLQVLALQQLKPWMRRGGVDGRRTLVIDVGVQILASGVAGLGIVGTAWAIKGGW